MTVGNRLIVPTTATTVTGSSDSTSDSPTHPPDVSASLSTVHSTYHRSTKLTGSAGTNQHAAQPSQKSYSTMQCSNYQLRTRRRHRFAATKDALGVDPSRPVTTVV